MYLLFKDFKKYKNYKKSALRKKMKNSITQYYCRQLYKNRIKNQLDFLNYIEKKYLQIFIDLLNPEYYKQFINLIISCLTK